MSEYPTIEQSVKRYAVLWNKWNCGDMEARDMLLQLDREGCFLEAVCKDWAEIIEKPYDVVLKANISEFHRFRGSKPSTKTEGET